MSGARGDRAIRVLLAEESATTREFLVCLLARDAALEVVGAARDGVEAVAETERLRPDVAVLDVHMPRLDGYQAARRIMERTPTPIVMVSASVAREEMAMTFEALRAGALTVVDKPTGPGDPRHEETARRLVEAVKLMAEVKVVRRWARREARPASPPLPDTAPRGIRLVAIGASTGGPQVLAELLRRLPANLGASILVVQHISPGFTEGLVDWLGAATPLAVRLAAQDDFLEARTAYLAPSGLQMGVSRAGRIRLVADPARSGFCPSASYLFASVAECYGAAAMGVLLTGMAGTGPPGSSVCATPADSPSRRMKTPA